MVDGSLEVLFSVHKPRRVRGSSEKTFRELATSMHRSRMARRNRGGGRAGMADTVDGARVVVGDIPSGMQIGDGDEFLFVSRDQGAYTHGIHKYPAKFFPELPRFLVSRYSKTGASVLDPFAGSGTTNLEALLLSRPSTAVDVDPFSRFLISNKVTALPTGLAAEAALVCVDAALRHDQRKKPAPVPEFPYREGWFAPHALDELAHLKAEIGLLPRRLRGQWSSEQKRGARDLMLVALSSIIRESSNADNNCTRTVVRKKLGKKVGPGLALRLFSRKAVGAALGMEEFSALCPAGVGVQIPEGSDARNIEGRAGRFCLAVTSPPYCNAVDYPRTHQLEMYWLGFADGSLSELKRSHVGTEVVRAAQYRELHETGVDAADGVIRAIYDSDPRRAFILYKYLADMQTNLREVCRVLEPGGRYCIAVGNNIIRGQVVENWRYIAELAQNSGFELESWFGSRIIRHFIKVPRKERIETDWVIVLRKPTSRS